MSIIDSNVIVALVLEYDHHHFEALNIVDGPENVVVPYSVIVETSIVLFRLTKDAQFVAHVIQDVARRFEILITTHELIEKTAFAYVRYCHQLSLVDCELMEWHKTTGARVLTFDQALQKHLETT